MYEFEATVFYPDESNGVLTPKYDAKNDERIKELIAWLLRSETEATRFVISVTRKVKS